MGSNRRRRATAGVALAAGLSFGLVWSGGATPAGASPPARPPIYVSFIWHLHQPIYYPYENLTRTAQSGAYSFDLARTHTDRAGPYTTWPGDAVQAAMWRGLPHAGAQVSFSGSLMENLDDLERNGWAFGGWTGRWRESNGWTTARGNPRLDLVGFAQHHPLLPLVDDEVARRQIGGQKALAGAHWGRGPSRGFFPPENAFAEHLIPSLVAEGFQWVVVDNIHLQRACQGYPWNPGGNLIPPNRAEQQNPDPRDWAQLRDLWAPTPVSAGWSYRPHLARHVDPDSGAEQRIVVVPTARYMGNEDGRGGFGALQYERVMSQLEQANTDPAHPVLIVLHHDGDNYGGGADSYYHANWERFLDWAQQNGQRFVPTTIQDYLDEFPPDAGDVVHVEPGSWSGADNGDPEFKKWLGDPGRDGYSPDVNSWAVMAAAANRVKTAGSLRPGSGEEREAWRLLLNGFTSCYWYWDGTEIWDSNPTRAANAASWHADQVLGAGAGAERVGPQVFLPQREPYNPGAMEWGPRPEPSDFEVWTLAYDASGLGAVTLLVRVDQDGQNPLSNDENETRAGGPGVGPWRAIPMRPSPLPAPRTNPQPTHRGERYSARVTGLQGVLVDYYVEATDGLGNVTRSPIQHVWVGGQGAPVRIAPTTPTADQQVRVSAQKPGRVHWGVDGWKLPAPAIRPAGSVEVAGALETPLQGPDAQGLYSAVLGPFLASPPGRIDLVIAYADGSWENAGGSDWRIDVLPAPVRTSPADPTWLDTISVRAAGPGAVRWGVNGWTAPPAGARPAGTVEVAGLPETPLQPAAGGGWEAVLGPFAGSLDVRELRFALRRADGSWDNAGGRDHRVALRPKAVWWSAPRLGSGPLLVFTREPGTIHWGHDGWRDVRDTPLVGPDATGVYAAALAVPAGAQAVDLALRRADGSWDNAGGRDYHVPR